MFPLARPVNICPRRLPSLKAAQARCFVGLRVQSPSLHRAEALDAGRTIRNTGPAKGQGGGSLLCPQRSSSLM